MMILFIVPVKSKTVTKDWNNFSLLFERTLKSIMRQTNSNYKVLVVHHEMPITQFQHPNLEFYQVPFLPPVTDNSGLALIEELREDKVRKILIGNDYALSYNFEYCMVVDSDDLISNRIVEMVCKLRSTEMLGWFINKGYVYQEGRPILFLNKNNFNSICGTCLIVKSENIPDFIVSKGNNRNYRHGRTIINNTPLNKFPFPAVIYSMNNGQNIYMNRNKIQELNFSKKNPFKLLSGTLRKLLKYRPSLVLSSKFSSEFGFYRIN